MPVVRRVVPHMDGTFGPDHKALEGFEQYEESLQAALIEEMIPQLKKASLAKDTPMPSVLQMGKEKDRRAEQARLAEAASESAGTEAVPGASAKPIYRPRSKSPNVPGAFGRKADMKAESWNRQRLTLQPSKRSSLFPLVVTIWAGSNVLQAGSRSETTYEACLF